MKNYAPEPFQFMIGDHAYTIQPLGFGDIEKATNIGDVIGEDVSKGVTAIRDLISARADKRTTEAVLALPPRNVLAFLKDWVGLEPGESSTSGDA